MQNLQVGLSFSCSGCDVKHIVEFDESNVEKKSQVAFDAQVQEGSVISN